MPTLWCASCNGHSLPHAWPLKFSNNILVRVLVPQEKLPYLLERDPLCLDCRLHIPSKLSLVKEENLSFEIQFVCVQDCCFYFYHTTY